MKLDAYNKSTLLMIKRYIEEVLMIDGLVKAENVPEDLEKVLHVLGDLVEKDTLKTLTELVLDSTIPTKKPEDSH